MPRPEEVYEAISELVFGDKGRTRATGDAAPRPPCRAGGADRRAGRAPVSLRRGQPAASTCTPTPRPPTAPTARPSWSPRPRRPGSTCWPSPTTTPPRGWDEAAAALPAGLRLLRGAEFSCVSPTGRGDRDVSVHLLGYLFDPEHEAIVAEQARLRTERRHRLHRIDREDGRRRLPGGPGRAARRCSRRAPAPAARTWPGRWSTAGVVGVGGRGVRDAALQRQPVLRAQGRHPGASTAIRMVRAAGGVPVFAHPLARRRGRVVEPSVIVELAAVGLGRRRGGPPRPQPGGPRPAARPGRATSACSPPAPATTTAPTRRPRSPPSAPPKTPWTPCWPSHRRPPARGADPGHAGAGARTVCASGVRAG